MKLTAILLLAACLQVSATGYSQKITLSVKDVPLKTVFIQINAQTGFNFLYSDEVLDKTKEVTLDVKDATLESVLALCFKDQPLNYSIVNNTIVVKQDGSGVTLSLSKGEVSVIDIHGKVVNENGKPVEGASVQVKGGGPATATDVDGNFRLNGVDDNATLVFTGADIEKLEVMLKGKKELLVSVKTKITAGEEVVINKGYYTERQKLSLGNVGTVKGEDINKQPVSDPILALEGRVAGLSISQSSGVPGAYSTIKLRGTNFFGAVSQTVNDPLYLVDGVPFSSQSLTNAYYGGGILGAPSIGDNNGGAARNGMSPFNMLNPADIESIEVLKDADATAIYGARGANGVILITTRRGKPGPMKIDVNVNAGTSRIARKWDLLNTPEYLTMRRESFNNDGISSFLISQFPQIWPDVAIWDTTRYTDWQKVLIDHPANYTNVQASISGGNAQTQYLVAGGYNIRGTTMPGDYNDKKANLSISVNSASINQRFHLSMTGMYSNDVSNLPQNNLAQYVTLPPDAPKIYDKNGNLNWEPYQGAITWANPFSYTKASSNATTDFLQGNLNLRYQVLPGLEISSNFGYNHSQMNYIAIQPATYFAPPNNFPDYRSAEYATSDNRGWIIEPQANYHKKLSIGTIDFLVGSTFQENSSSSIASAAHGFSNDALISNPQAGTTFNLRQYDLSSYRYNSIFSRIGYNWQEKYLINLTARRDGSSRFGPGKQFGNFGAVAGGWIFSKEGFVDKGLPWLSFGKLRASYGLVGSDGVGDYQYIRTYSIPSGSGATYQGLQSLTPNGHANPYFQWQSNKKFEFGTELGFLKDRVHIMVSYYKNRCGNQLAGYPLPGVTGFTSVTQNLNALVQNSGWEFEANTVNVQSKDFRWTSSFNISFNKNKLVSFPGIDNTPSFRTYAVGKSINSRMLYHYLGVDAQTGSYTFASKDGTGVPNLGDLIWSKPLIAKYFGGFDNTFGYKGFSIDIFIQFSKQPGALPLSQQNPGSLAENGPTLELRRWQKTGDITNVEKFASIGRPADQYQFFQSSDAAYVDASYIRFKNVAVSYQVPAKWLGKAHLQNVRVYMNIQNLLTFTHYLGIDPESPGFTVPPMRTITGGIQITL